ncbi:pre-mRNA splicing factor 18, putative [Eimeria maxima]|uniref:Pre-mRNA-splicing factor 18 n=1 Tax=Eimeria maxima TaxID=5804 RepID=U6M517_EIMMA|nr:pre-mRNA splicing factor 18, putative [Eimeria maxima]CDJ59106.1 pre-mRNA splicing factor 18, putative [Eimeria maxima]
MDALRAIIAKQKQQLNAIPKAGDKKYIFQRDLDQKLREEKLKEKEELADRKRKAELEQLAELQDRIKARPFQKNPEAEAAAAATTECADTTEGTDEEREPPVELQEIFRRLRKLKQPITLFAETPWKRYCRLCKLEVQVIDDEMTEGQKNVFHAMQREGEEEEEFEEESKPVPSSEKGEAEKSDAAAATQNTKSKETTEQTKEAAVIGWARKMLSLWEEELKSRSEDEKATAEGMQATALHRQTKKDLKPLFKKLKHRDLEADILEKLFDIVSLCEERKYRDAHGAFMLLAIGNAAWPMGVTMVVKEEQTDCQPNSFTGLCLEQATRLQQQQQQQQLLLLLTAATAAAAAEAAGSLLSLLLQCPHWGPPAARLALCCFLAAAANQWGPCGSRTRNNYLGEDTLQQEQYTTLQHKQGQQLQLLLHSSSASCCVFGRPVAPAAAPPPAAASAAAVPAVTTTKAFSLPVAVEVEASTEATVALPESAASAATSEAAAAAVPRAVAA